MIPFYSSYQKATFSTTRNCSNEKYVSSKLIMILFLTCKFIVTWKLRRLRSLPEGIIGSNIKIRFILQLGKTVECSSTKCQPEI